MLILDIPRRSPLDLQYIEIPHYHRTHLNIAQTRRLALCLLPKLIGTIKSKSELYVPEIIATPYPFRSWSSLRRITATFRDRPGIISDLIQVLQSFNTTIYTSESGTSGDGSHHALEMVVAFPAEEDPNDIHTALSAQLIEDLAFDMEDRPRLRVRRVETLWQAWYRYKSFQNLDTDHSSRGLALTPRTGLGTLRYPLEPQPALTSEAGEQGVGDPPKRGNLRLYLPTVFRQALSQHLIDHSADGPTREVGYQVRTSDTKDRVLRVLFIPQHERLLHARIEHDRVESAFLDITHALKTGKFNILTEYSGPLNIPESHPSGEEPTEVNQSKQRLEVLLHAPVDVPAAPASMKAALESALSLVPQAANITVDYPQDYGPSSTVRPVVGMKSRGSLSPKITSKNRDRLLRRRVDAVMERLGNSRKDGNVLSILDEKKLKLSKALIRKLRYEGDVISVFISCPYQGEFKKRILEICESIPRIKPIVADELFQDPNFRKGILRLLSDSTHFLGVWTNEEGSALNNGFYYPSPWLIWEAGAAETLGLRQLFMISDKIEVESWRKIYPLRQHLQFNTTNFETTLRNALTQLIKPLIEPYSPIQEDSGQ